MLFRSAHCLRADHSASEAAVADIRLFGAWADYPAIAFDPYDALRILLTEKKLMGKRLGYEGDFLPIQQYQKLQALSGGAEMVDAGELLKRFNAVKNDYEINLMRLSSYLTNIGMRAAVEHIRQSEAEASMAAEAAMREAWKRDLVEFEVSGFGNTEGGIPTALWCYALSGHRVPYGAECPGARVPKAGEISLPIVWAAIEGYHAEKERSIIIERLDEPYAAYYQAMLRARKAAVDAVQAGAVVGEVYQAAINHYNAEGLPHMAPGRIGHGMGLSLHDFPSLDRGSSVVLEAGMVFTIEPSLNFKGWGSIRHSDTVLVLDNGCEVLTRDDSLDEYLVR